MKTRRFGHWGLGVSLTLLPLVANCLADNPADNPPMVADAPAQTGAAETNAQTVPAPELGLMAATNAIDIADAPATPISDIKPAPTNIRPGRPAAEIIKLANSGVEESVMMAFVTNSTSTFNLSAEEIIYLKDIGVPDPVVTAMILRDQTLRAESSSALAAAPPPLPPEMPVASEPANVAPQPDASVASYPPEAAPPPSEVAPDSAFYDSLAPYGSWMNLDGYGPCWQPTVVVVNPAWQPYYNYGHWIYTDCGWYWMSGYSWGWAPFHYGRWFCHHRLGWCWIPNRTWGPSWVSWRYNDGYCGWAPLPPGTGFTAGVGLTFHGRYVNPAQDMGLSPAQYRFVAWNHFYDHAFQHYRLPATTQDQLFRHSVAATRFTGQDGKIANDGLPPQKVAAATRTQVRSVALRDSTDTAPSGGRTEHLDTTRRMLTVYRPNFGSALSAPSSPSAESALSAPSSPSAGSGPMAVSSQGRPAQNAPLILRGPQSSATQEKPPPSSLVVIGRKDPNGNQTTYRTFVPSASSRQASSSVSPTPWADNQLARESVNQNWQQAPSADSSYSQPVYVPRNSYGYERPATSYRPTVPTYQAPVRNAPAEAPRYAAPAQRSYAAPAPAMPARATPPAPFAPAPTQSGGRNQSR